MSVNGLTVVESWIVEDTKMDKSAKYGLEMPEGTWMISMKVENDEIWTDYVKTGKVKVLVLRVILQIKHKLKNQIQKQKCKLLKKKRQNICLVILRH